MLDSFIILSTQLWRNICNEVEYRTSSGHYRKGAKNIIGLFSTKFRTKHEMTPMSRTFSPIFGQVPLAVATGRIWTRICSHLYKVNLRPESAREQFSSVLRRASRATLHHGHSRVQQAESWRVRREIRKPRRTLALGGQEPQSPSAFWVFWGYARRSLPHPGQPSLAG